MNKCKKILTILIVLVISSIVISTISFADKYTPTKFGSAIGNANVDVGEIKDVGGQIVGTIQIIGTIVSVGTMMFIGIKYVLGSAEEKASYKKSLIPYFVGAVLIFGATNLTQIIYNWTTDSIVSSYNPVVDWDMIGDITDKYVSLDKYDIKEESDATIKKWYEEVSKLSKLEDFEITYSATYKVVADEYERRFK